MGSPQSLTAEQKATLEKAGELQTMGAPTHQPIAGGHLTINMSLPRQGVALLTIAVLTLAQMRNVQCSMTALSIQH